MLSIELSPNDSPGMGTDGSLVSMMQLKERVLREGENDVALKVEEGAKKGSGRSIKVTGRGDLHLGILFEKMRREGYEFTVSQPEIYMKTVDNVLYEPVERVTVEVDEQFEKTVVDMLQPRKAALASSTKVVKGKAVTVKLVVHIPARGFIGCRSEMMGKTRGTALIYEEFVGLEKFKGPIKRNPHGSIIAMTEGKATAFALVDIEKKGKLFVAPGYRVYPGLVIGENTLEYDVEMNACKAKRITNVRTHTHEEAAVLKPPRLFNIDEALAYIRDDEIVEVTPKQVRIRKKILDGPKRRRLTKAVKAQEKAFEAEE